MAVFLVAYDLNSPGQHHAELLKKIKKFPWARLSESSYAIEAGDLDPVQIRSLMRGVIDANDTLIVIALALPFASFASKKVNEWLLLYLS